MMVTLLAFFVTLGVLIVVHEYGHYRVAVACGVRVLRFSIGFGRVLWRRQSRPDGTEFVVCVLPLGGYVRMLDEREGEVAASELDRAFNRKPLWQRAAIVVAGPIANLLLAVVLYSAAHWIGVDEPKAVIGPPAAGSVVERAGMRAGDWVRAWSQEGSDWQDVRSLTDLRWQATQAMLHAEDIDLLVSTHDGRGQRRVHLALASLGAADVDAKTMQRIGLGSAWSEPVLGKVEPGGAGAASGLKQGDRIVAIDGVPIDDASQARDAIRNSGKSGTAQPMHWRIERGGTRMELVVTPRIAIDAGSRVGRLELYPGQPAEMTSVRYGPVEGMTSALTQTWQMSTLTLKMLGKMIIGQASLKNLSGPVTIADYAGQSVRLGLAYYLGFLAVVSVSLGVLNLLPLPVLDGGHLMYYLFEAVTGRQVSDLWLDRLQRGGVAIMLMMMSLALYNDMARLLGLQ
ncbi:MAG TPA: RIP metalloprotease RseP [Caldimonas sp.]|nr:RIP metalloprotease RseP [Caldimonas sp.]HEX4234041.1 RIP metalloprotease RseP [Caldimonas sp.]